jgi:hypothetical protein
VLCYPWTGTAMNYVFTNARGEQDAMLADEVEAIERHNFGRQTWEQYISQEPVPHVEQVAFMPLMEQRPGATEPGSYPVETRAFPSPKAVVVSDRELAYLGMMRHMTNANIAYAMERTCRWVMYVRSVYNLQARTVIANTDADIFIARNIWRKMLAE